MSQQDYERGFQEGVVAAIRVCRNVKTGELGETWPVDAACGAILNGLRLLKPDGGKSLAELLRGAELQGLHLGEGLREPLRTRCRKRRIAELEREGDES